MQSYTVGFMPEWLPNAATMLLSQFKSNSSFSKHKVNTVFSQKDSFLDFQHICFIMKSNNKCQTFIPSLIPPFAYCHLFFLNFLWLVVLGWLNSSWWSFKITAVGGESNYRTGCWPVHNKNNQHPHPLIVITSPKCGNINS